MISKKKDNRVIETNEGVTIVVFSGDLDKAIAAFIIANGALAMGKKVTIFFTFWGLSILKKETLGKKSFIEKMFAMMLPKNSEKLPVSKMNFLGIGAKLIRWTMKKKNIMSLEELMRKSIESGANITACTMSMEVMGITQEELIDGIGYGVVGVLLSFIIGATAAGPLYAAFPVAGVLLRKGTSIFNVLIFIGAWSTMKIPLLIFESTALGYSFSMLRLGLNIVGIPVIAFIISVFLKEKDKEEIYSLAQERE